ncbi:MAG: FeoB-associated Cys-rich membrane protein [Erysipelotrichaceae bacterium]|nr:FeoB-associated Cys-rich membrane protein [Erysipelotrichaceae bacterium]
MNWIYANYGTIIVSIILLAVIYLASYSIYSDKKKGKSSCGSNCAHCANACSCHNIKETLKHIND